MKQIYLFSGLGADERAFRNLDFSGCESNFIRWELPYKDESIEHYAGRLLRQIKSDQPILVGLSFGGMIAVETAKQIQTSGVILISSAKTWHEIPYYYRVAGKLWLDKLIPAALLMHFGIINNWLFGVESEEDKKLLSDILQDTNPVFLKWAIQKIVQWKNESFIQNLKHIHGTGDKILPIRYVIPDFTVKGGGHMMILNRADEVSGKIREALGVR